MKATKTTYMVEGCKEPCWEVTDGFSMVRISPFYHYVGRDTLLVSEYIDGDFNSEEEINGDFASLTASDAVRIAKENCAYLN